jgi:dihydroorotase
VKYTLLIKGGRVLDPGRGLDADLDIALAGDTIAAIEPEIDPGDAEQVLDAAGPGRYVLPGLADIHTHVGYGATTSGVGMGCCDPDYVGVQSGVTTVVDAGSVGVANVGVFPAHIIPRARTRVLCFVNVGSHAHTMPDSSDVTRLEDIHAEAIAACVAANPGLVKGFKIRLVGPVVEEHGEDVIRRVKEIARSHSVPLMVHIGDSAAAKRSRPERMREITEFLLDHLDAGDILTHLCTPNPGGAAGSVEETVPLFLRARERGVVLDAAVGRGNFGIDVARELRDRGVAPDTVSSDITATGQTFHSLLECMAKFMAVGYNLDEVVRMTTANAAAAIGLGDEIGALAVGRTADITIMDVVEGDFGFVDTTQKAFQGRHGLKPVQTVRRGELHAPRWGTHPWGWLPAANDRRA